MTENLKSNTMCAALLATALSVFIAGCEPPPAPSKGGTDTQNGTTVASSPVDEGASNADAIGENADAASRGESGDRPLPGGTAGDEDVPPTDEIATTDAAPSDAAPSDAAPSAANDKPEPVANAEPMPSIGTLSASAKSWPIFRGDSLSSGVAQSTLPEKLELLWRYTVKDGGFETTPAIVEGLVYVGDFDGNLHAIDFEQGEKKWEFEGTLGFVASPSVRDGLLYIGDLQGNFYCLDAKTGEKKWDYTTEGEIDSSANFYNDCVLIGSQDATLYCLKAKSGEEVWKFTIDDQIRCTPTIVENRCFLAGCDGKLHIVDLDKGERVAEVEIESPTGTTPAVHGERVYFGTHAGAFFCIDWKKPEIVWTFRHEDNPGEYRSSAAVTATHVIVGDRGRRVYSLNTETGEKQWEMLTKKNVDSSPVIVGERVFVGTGDGNLYALNLKSGDVLWQYEAGGGFIGSPAVADGRLVIAGDDGVVYCFGEKKE